VLTEAQEERYKQLRTDLEAALPIIEKLGLV
jgi:hypothetical protein